MALHDYVCPGCGRAFVDVNVPISIGAQAGRPVCPDDGRVTEWIPKVGRMDAYEPFQEFDTTDGRGRPVHVDSLRKLRAVERESEQMTKDGVGQPMVWRQYSQDRSNRDQHTLGDLTAGTAAPDKRFLDRNRQAVRAVAEEHGTLGPGVHEDTSSPLDTLQK